MAEQPFDGREAGVGPTTLSSSAEAEWLRTPKPRVPNRISWLERMLNLVLSGFLLVHGTLGVWHNDIPLPGNRSDGFHVHGFPMWLI